MRRLNGKNILIVIPKSQFCEEELAGIYDPLKDAGSQVIVLSKSGQEARGMNKTKFQPDGILVDWDKQPKISGKYDAVLVLGGKGSAKSLWDDPILPQILTDHHRAGKIVGAIGASIVVLIQAGLVQGSTPAPKDDKTRQVLKEAGITPTDTPFYCSDRVLIAKDVTAVQNLIKATIEYLES